MRRYHPCLSNPAGPADPKIEGTGPSRPSPIIVRADEAQVRRTPTPPHGQRSVLELSPAARALAARVEGDDALSAERLIELRQRVLDGRYDSPAVLEAIADALVRSSDLG